MLSRTADRPWTSLAKGSNETHAVVPIGIELAELLDIAEAILRADEHAMAIQHVREADSGVFQDRKSHEPGTAGEEMLLSRAAVMEGVVNEREDVGAADVVDRGQRLALEAQRRDREAERLDEALEAVILQDRSDC